MIALDTNVLLRYLVQDDPAQFALAETFLESELSSDRPGFISLVVVCETAWALDRTFGLARDAIAAAIAGVASTPQFALESVEIVRTATNQSEFTIADAIIHLAGRARACTKTITFDRKFARMEGVELLE